jgi:hypothetical protein
MFNKISRRGRVAAVSLALAASGLATTGPAAAAVISSAQYQKMFTLVCDGTSLCHASMPATPAKHRLIVEQVTCQLVGDDYPALPGGLDTRTSTNSLVFRQYLTPVYKMSGHGTSIYDQEMDDYIPAGQHGELFIGAIGGNVYGANCSLTGTLQTLG